MTVENMTDLINFIKLVAPLNSSKATVCLLN